MHQRIVYSKEHEKCRVEYTTQANQIINRTKLNIPKVQLDLILFVYFSDDQSSFDKAAGSSAQQLQNVTEDSCPSTFQKTWTSRKRPRGNFGYAKAMHTWAADQQAFYQKMQESQNKWTEEQQERCQQREERFLLRFLEESSHSTEHIVRQCFDGLKSIMTQMSQPPQGMPPYSPQHQYPVQSGCAKFSQNPSYNSDYHLYDLG